MIAVSLIENITNSTFSYFMDKKQRTAGHQVRARSTDLSSYTPKVLRTHLTQVPDVPHGVNIWVTLVENDEQWRSRHTFRQCFTVQVFPEATAHLTFKLFQLTIRKKKKMLVFIFTHLKHNTVPLTTPSFHQYKKRTVCLAPSSAPAAEWCSGSSTLSGWRWWPRD